MHPTIAYELAKIKIEEDLQYAARERLARAVRKDRPRAVDFSSLGERLRARLGAGPRLGQPSATAGA